MKKEIYDGLLIIAIAAGLSGCLWIKSEPIEIEPIHVTVDVNVRTERELRDFFQDIDKADPTIETAPETQTESENSGSTGK